MHRRILLAAAGLFCAATLVAREPETPPVKVACVGNSITYGLGIADREKDSYPAQLQALLGSGYQVGNFGKSGATLLRQGHRPYMEQEEFRAAMDFAGDIVVIHLGINDTDPRNWPHFGDAFVSDYLALIDSLRSRNPAARILVARMTPISHTHSRFLSGTRDWHTKIQEEIAVVARAAGAQLIDFYEPLHRFPWMFSDGLHPSAEGAGILARIVYESITGRYGGLRMPMLYSDGMVLPRGKVFPLRGRADAGERVRVSLAGQTAEATAGADGCWEVLMGPFAPQTGAKLRITAPSRTLVYRDVALGDIWLCSGQSNMEFELGQSDTAPEAARAADGGLRLFDMKARWRTDAVAWPAEALDSINRLEYFAPARWEAASPSSAARFSAVGYYFGRALRDSLKVPVGLICNAVGGATTESWISRSMLENEYPEILFNWLQNDHIMAWARGRAAQNLSNRPAGAPDRHPYEPCYLWEAGIVPLEGFPLTGVIWYQGESNAERMEVHERLFPLLVDAWRESFGQTLPFYYVQLSSLNRPSWPAFRDSQLRLLGCREGLGMVVCSDLGDPWDVHYRSKRPVGQRLARLALADTYGRPLVSSGPIPLEAVALPGRIEVRLLWAEGLSGAGNVPITGFELQDAADGLYHPVNVSVTGDSVVIDLKAPALDGHRFSAPLHVRYGWEPYTRANLVNAAGLPASTFRLLVE